MVAPSEPVALSFQPDPEPEPVVAPEAPAAETIAAKTLFMAPGMLVGPVITGVLIDHVSILAALGVSVACGFAGMLTLSRLRT